MPVTRRREGQIAQQPQRSARAASLVSDHAALAGGDDLVGVEAEAGHVAEAAGHTATALGPMRFRAVLDHNEIVSPGDRVQPIHVDRVAEQMNGNDGAGARRDQAFSRSRSRFQVSRSESTGTGTALA